MGSVNIEVNIEGDMKAAAPPPKEPFKFELSTVTSKIPSVGAAFQLLRQNIRPWTEFINFQNLKTSQLPGSLPRLSNRYMRNLIHFQSNYLIISLVLMLYCLLTSPLILIVLAGSLYASYKIKQAQSSIQVFGRSLNPNQQCVLVHCAVMPLLYLAGAGSIMFWVVGASFFIISLHAVFYNIDAVAADETDGFSLPPNIV